MHLFDAYGDGWNGATIALTDCNDAQLTEEATYTIGLGDYLIHDICITSDAGLQITVGGGSWDSEISWQLLDADSFVIA